MNRINRNREIGNVIRAVVRQFSYVAAFLAFVAITVSAQIIVNSTEDPGTGVCDVTECTLREAIRQANATPGDDVIDFDAGVFSGPTTITLVGGQLSIGGINSGKLTINGPGSHMLAISGNNSFRVLQLNAGFVAEINGLTITEGRLGDGSIGGGILNFGMLTISSSTISNSRANDGAGIYNLGSLTVRNSSVVGNIASHTVTTDCYGGGIANHASLVMTGSTVSGNSVCRWGSGLLNWSSATAIVTNSTISGNSGGTLGGGVYNQGSLDITNSTIARNSASVLGGGLYAGFSSTTNLINSILGDNTGGGDCIREDTGSETVNSYNSLIEQGIQFCVNGTNSNTLTGDAMLGTLENNGGPTLTHELLPGSLAINAGSNALALDPMGNPLTYDQRGAGYERILDGTVDMGAFESTSVVDSDGDGVLDADDLCPDTVIPETGDFDLKKNRFAVDANGNFIDGDGTTSGYTIADTGGCSASQIIEVGGFGAGHERFGITRSVLEYWIAMLPPH